MFSIERLNLRNDGLHAAGAERRIVIMVAEIGEHDLTLYCVDEGDLLPGSVHGTADGEGRNDPIG